MSEVRAKFYCSTVTPNEYGGTNVVLYPVTASSEENARFFNATPSGKVELVISEGMAAANAFKPGAEYYVDFTEVIGTTQEAAPEAEAQSQS